MINHGIISSGTFVNVEKHFGLGVYLAESERELFSELGIDKQGLITIATSEQMEDYAMFNDIVNDELRDIPASEFHTCPIFSSECAYIKSIPGAQHSVQFAREGGVSAIMWNFEDTDAINGWYTKLCRTRHDEQLKR